MALGMVRHPCRHQWSVQVDKILTDPPATGVKTRRVRSSSSANRSPPRASSQPPLAAKNVAFDLQSEASAVSDADPKRHRKRGETSRGYEAEHDSDSTIDGRDQRYPTHHPISETESDPEQGSRQRSHRRRRGTYDDDRDHDRHSRSRLESKSRHKDAPPDGPLSPTGSDVTVDLPERFDRRGRKKPERGDDAVADFLDQMLSGKGPGGKYLKKLFAGAGGDEGDDHGGHRRRR
jgi:hypothetical protein